MASPAASSRNPVVLPQNTPISWSGEEVTATVQLNVRARCCFGVLAAASSSRKLVFPLLSLEPPSTHHQHHHQRLVLYHTVLTLMSLRRAYRYAHRHIPRRCQECNPLADREPVDAPHRPVTATASEPPPSTIRPSHEAASPANKSDTPARRTQHPPRVGDGTAAGIHRSALLPRSRSWPSNSHRVAAAAVDPR